MKLELVDNTLLVEAEPEENVLWSAAEVTLEMGKVVQSESELEIGERIFYPASAGMEIRSGAKTYRLLHISNVVLRCQNGASDT